MGIIEKYGHGGDLHTASAVFEVNEAEWLDYSANINPLGPPKRVMEKLQEQFHTIIRYPDPAQRVFRRKLAEKLKISEDMLLAGNGAAECMALAILGLAPRKVGVIYPCFSEYVQLAKQFGAEVLSCTATEEMGFWPEEKALYTLFENADLVFIGHPNNPTGQCVTKERLDMLAEWAVKTRTDLVIDEAFLDFLPPDKQVTLHNELNRYPRVILIRSLTKLYAIPGLRLGYMAAQPDTIAKMRAKQVSWSVNQLALLAGELCLDEEEYVAKTRQLIQTERWFLIAAMSRLGWQVWSGEANFLLVRLPKERSARELQQKLGQKGVLIRNCEMYPGLTLQDFRIAVRTRDENQRLICAMQEVSLDWGDPR
jgi:threonine-phosphate decarboxylase